MSTTPAQSVVSRAPSSWTTAAAAVALACSLTPLLALFSSVPWTSALLSAPYLSLILGVAVIVATHHRRSGPARRIAWASLAVTAGWVLLLIAFGLELRFG